MDADADTAKATIDLGAGQAAAAVDNAPSGREAFRLASQFAEQLRAWSETIGRKRGPAAKRVQQEEALSLAHLAREIGVSRTRAVQLVEGIEVGADE